MNFALISQLYYTVMAISKPGHIVQAIGHSIQVSGQTAQGPRQTQRLPLDKTQIFKIFHHPQNSSSLP